MTENQNPPSSPIALLIKVISVELSGAAGLSRSLQDTYGRLFDTRISSQRTMGADPSQSTNTDPNERELPDTSTIQKLQQLDLLAQTLDDLGLLLLKISEVNRTEPTSAQKIVSLINSLRLRSLREHFLKRMAAPSGDLGHGSIFTPREESEQQIEIFP